MESIICFAPSTMVSTPHGAKRIDAVQCGDQILAWNTSLAALVQVLVTRTAKSRHAVLSKILFSNEAELLCTPDHPLWVEGKGWCAVFASDVMEKYGVEAATLSVGDRCLFYELGNVGSAVVNSIEQIEEEQDFYTISAGEEHCFFANGILVHDENVALLNLTGTAVQYQDLADVP